MDTILIKKIALSSITIGLNLVLPTQVWALPEVNHQSNQYIDIDTFCPKQFSEKQIFSPVARGFQPSKKEEEGPPDDAGKGAGSR